MSILKFLDKSTKLYVKNKAFEILFEQAPYTI